MDYKKEIQRSIDYIESHLCENIKLQDIARESYFSEFHFHRLFSKVSGRPVMEYVKEKRLTKAAKELQETDEKIISIAIKYQFSSGESFSRAFKQYFGISPREYRTTGRLISNHRISKKPFIRDRVMCKAA